MYDPEERRPSMLKPILIGGLIAGVLSLIPGIGYLNFCCCLLFIAGAVIGVVIYKASSPMGFSAGKGAVIGLFVGIVGGIIDTIVAVVFGIIISGNPETFESVKAKLVAMAEQSSSQMPNPEAGDMAVQMYSSLTQQDLMVMCIVAGVVLTIVGTVFSLLGGLITAAIIGKPKMDMGDGMPTPYETQ